MNMNLDGYWWRLDGHTPVQCTLAEYEASWAARMRGPDDGPWRVDRTALFDNVYVSTVFLSIDHNWMREGPPLLFETMVFGLDDEGGDLFGRASTWDDAQTMHDLAVADTRRQVERRLEREP